VSPQEGTYLEPSDINEPVDGHEAVHGNGAVEGDELIQGSESLHGGEAAEGNELIRGNESLHSRDAVEGNELGDGDGGSEQHGVCTMVSETLARIGDKWTVLVVELLCAGRGPVRFNEIRRAIDGISQRMLTLTLRGLERDGLVTRTVHPTVPPRVDYELTELGQSLRVPLVAVAEWARANRGSIVESRKVFDATSTASPSSRQVRRRAPALLSRARLARPEPL
jgi:DNA-binding HxlR family transcriptional regulator